MLFCLDWSELPFWCQEQPYGDFDYIKKADIFIWEWDVNANYTGCNRKGAGLMAVGTGMMFVGTKWMKCSSVRL